MMIPNPVSQPVIEQKPTLWQSGTRSNVQLQPYNIESEMQEPFSSPVNERIIQPGGSCGSGVKGFAAPGKDALARRNRLHRMDRSKPKGFLRAGMTTSKYLEYRYGPEHITKR